MAYDEDHEELRMEAFEEGSLAASERGVTRRARPRAAVSARRLYAELEARYDWEGRRRRVSPTSAVWGTRMAGGRAA